MIAPQVNEAIPIELLEIQYNRGLILWPAPDEVKAFVDFQIATVWRVLERDISSELHPEIIGVYLFDESVCSGDFNSADGMCSTSFPSTGGRGVSIIGIGKQGIAKGAEYVQFLLIHELSHAISWNSDPHCSHNVHYHNNLDRLLAKFNIATGSNLINDYA